MGAPWRIVWTEPFRTFLKNAGAARRVWVGPKPYAELAGLILQEKYGFNVQRLDQAGVNGPQFSDPLVPIRADAGR